MTEVLSIIGLIIAAAFFTVGGYLDLHSSVRGKFYGTKESNPLLVDADNDISVPKKVGFTAAFGIGAILVFLFIHQIVGIGILVILGALQVFIALQNYSKQKKNREQQVKWLTRTAQYTPDQAEELFQQRHFDVGTFKRPKSGKIYFSLFKWITDSSPEGVRRRLVELANKPSGQWFPEGGK